MQIVAQVELKNGLHANTPRQGDFADVVEPARAQNCRIQRGQIISCADEHDALCTHRHINLLQKAIDHLAVVTSVLFLVAVTGSGGVDFVDEQDAGGCGDGLIKALDHGFQAVAEMPV